LRFFFSFGPVFILLSLGVLRSAREIEAVKSFERLIVTAQVEKEEEGEEKGKK